MGFIFPQPKNKENFRNKSSNQNNHGCSRRGQGARAHNILERPNPKLLLIVLSLKICTNLPLNPLSDDSASKFKFVHYLCTFNFKYSHFFMFVKKFWAPICQIPDYPYEYNEKLLLF